MSDYKKEIMEAFRKKFELHDVGKSQFTICTNSGDNTCNGGVSVDEIELESAEKLLENIESFLSQAIDRVAKEAREEERKIRLYSPTELQRQGKKILEDQQAIWKKAYEFGYRKGIHEGYNQKMTELSPSEEKEESGEKECEHCFCKITQVGSSQCCKCGKVEVRIVAC